MSLVVTVCVLFLSDFIYVYSLFLSLSFFFFKQKPAYEMLRSLVGSEMCIRDSATASSSRSGGSAPSASPRTFAARAAAKVRGEAEAGSYKHLTLPTSYSV